MHKIFNTDRGTLGTQVKTPQGYILADVVLARSGILEYTGTQIGKPELGDRLMRVYRPPEELQSIETIDSFRHTPFTVNHPSGASAPDGMLNPENVKEFTDGIVTENVRFDTDTLKAKVLITSDKAHRALKRIKESSIGFYSTYEYTPGVTPDGEAYDAIQRNILGNHVALVESGRSGDTCRVLDSKINNNGGGEMPDVIIKVAGLDCTVEKNSATIIEKEITSLDAKLASKDAVIAERDTELATKDAALIEAQKENKLLKERTSEEHVMKALDSRIELVQKAQKLHPEIECKGKKASVIMQEALVFVNKDTAAQLEGKSDEYINAFFDVALSVAEKKSGLDAALGRVVNNDGNDDLSVARKARNKAIEDSDNDFIGNTLGV